MPKWAQIGLIPRWSDLNRSQDSKPWKALMPSELRTHKQTAVISDVSLILLLVIPTPDLSTTSLIPEGHGKNHRLCCGKSVDENQPGRLFGIVSPFTAADLAGLEVLEYFKCWQIHRSCADAETRRFFRISSGFFLEHSRHFHSRLWFQSRVSEKIAWEQTLRRLKLGMVPWWVPWSQIHQAKGVIGWYPDLALVSAALQTFHPSLDKGPGEGQPLFMVSCRLCAAKIRDQATTFWYAMKKVCITDCKVCWGGGERKPQGQMLQIDLNLVFAFHLSNLWALHRSHGWLCSNAFYPNSSFIWWGKLSCKSIQTMVRPWRKPKRLIYNHTIHDSPTPIKCDRLKMIYQHVSCIYAMIYTSYCSVLLVLKAHSSEPKKSAITKIATSWMWS